MATFNKFNKFVEDLAHGVHNFSSHTLVVALTATANAPVNTNSVLADLTQISYTNFAARGLVTSSSSHTAGLYKLVITDKVISVSGGAGAAFQYIVIYNDNPTSPADPLVGWFNYGSALTLQDGEQLTLDFDGTNGLLTIQ